MKKLYFACLILSLTTYSGIGQTIFELEPSQSMLMTGKGPGQDGAINPYSDTNSYGIVENIGEHDFDIRIQQAGKIIEIITIKPKEIKKVSLLKGYELYFDCELKSIAKLEFQKIE